MIKKNHKRGQIAIYFVFIILAVFIILITAVFAPMGILFNTEMYRAGENIVLQSQDSINEIQDEEIRNKLISITDQGLAATENNIAVNNSLFQYGWVLIIFLTAIVLFLYTRQTVEFGRGGVI
jgi:predicted PurR-regulated permease PerM